MRTITCPHCKADNPADALVCEDCGTSLFSHDAINDNQLEPDEPAANETEQLLDWLKDLEPANERSEQASAKAADISEGETESDTLADWLAELSSQKEDWEDVEDREAITGWFDGTEDIYEERDSEPLKLDQTAPLSEYHEVEGIPEQLASSDLPDWLKQEQPFEESSFEEYESLPEEPELWTDDGVQPGTELQSVGGEVVPPEFSSSEPEDKSTSDEFPELKDKVPSENTEGPADWYSELAFTDVESALDELLDEQGKPAGDILSDQWMDLVDEIPESEDEPVAKSSFLEETTDLSDSEIPDWLESLKPEELVDPAAVDQPAEKSGPLIGLKGVIPMAAVAADPVEMGSIPEYTMTKGQQQQVALLKRLTMAEPAVLPSESRPAIEDNFIAFRLVIGLVLIVIVIAGWFLPSINEILPSWVMPPVPTYTEAAYSALDIASGRPVLVAFEYTPAMAGELDPVAISFLQRLAANNSTVFTISQVAAGVPVAGRAIEQVEELDSQALGYLPGDAIGLRNFASCIDAVDACANVTGLSMEEETQSLLGQIGLVIVLSGERDAIVNWIEQVGAQVEVPMISGITQAMSPVAAPYIASGQLDGLVGGLPAVAAIDNNVEEDDNFVEKAMNSITLSQWMAVIVLIIGALFYGLAGLAPAGAKKQA